MSVNLNETLKPHEMPALWGSPAKPDFPLKIQLIYGIGYFVALVVGSLQNNLIISYVNYLQGDLGISQAQSMCVSAAYYMGNTWATVVLYKARQHFGIKTFFHIVFSLLIFANFIQLLDPTFTTTIIARFINGIIGSGITILSVFYTVEMLGSKYRYMMFAMSIGLIQVGSAFSRFIVAYFSVSDIPHLMAFFEIGISLLALTVFLLIELPPSRVGKSFYWADTSIVFYAIATAIFCFIFSITTVLWWNYDFIAYCLCIAIASFGIFFVIEFFKERPFILFRFMTNFELIEVALSAAFVRMCLAEQTTGATGLFRNVLGFSDYQLAHYYGVVSLGALFGGILSIIIIRFNRTKGMMLSAVGMIVVGSFLSTKLSINIMPENLYLGQFIIAAGSIFFIGPLMTSGALLGLSRGVQYMMTFSAVFLFSQSIFGLLGSTIINYFIKTRTAQYLQDLINRSPDTSMMDLNFKTEATKQAGVLAYGDLFFIIGIIASILFLILLARYVYFFKFKHIHPIGRELNILKHRSIVANARTAKILQQEKGE